MSKNEYAVSIVWTRDSPQGKVRKHYLLKKAAIVPKLIDLHLMKPIPLPILSSARWNDLRKSMYAYFINNNRLNEQ